MTAKVVGFTDADGWGVMHGYPAGDSVLLLYDRARYFDPTAWIWQRGMAAAVPLVVPDKEAVVDFNGDGKTLVWVQAPPPAADTYDDYGDGFIWTSPMATAQTALRSTKRRAAPLIGSSGLYSQANEGMYAFANGKDGLIHIYRMSDMQHWSFKPEDSPPISWPRYVDAEEVWYTSSLGVYRQTIAALGPGDAP